MKNYNHILNSVIEQTVAVLWCNFILLAYTNEAFRNFYKELRAFHVLKVLSDYSSSRKKNNLGAFCSNVQVRSE